MPFLLNKRTVLDTHGINKDETVEGAPSAETPRILANVTRCELSLCVPPPEAPNPCVVPPCSSINLPVMQTDGQKALFSN